MRRSFFVLCVLGTIALFVYVLMGSDQSLLQSSETLRGVIVGGLISSIPSIIAACVQLFEQDNQRRHELRMQCFELVDTKRIKALTDYIAIITSVLSGIKDSNYTSAEARHIHFEASAYVSSDALELMNKILSKVLWVYSALEYREVDPDSRQLLMSLRRMLVEELDLYLEVAHEPTRRRNKKQTH